MSFTIAAILSIGAVFFLLIFLGYRYKNAFLILLSGLIGFLTAVMFWMGGIVEESGSNVAGNFTSSGVVMSQQSIYTPVNFGFPQSIIGTFFALLGLFFLIQAVGAFAKGGKM